MDEVIKCVCGKDDHWVIGTGGIRCSICHFFLPDIYEIDIKLAEYYISGYCAGKDVHKEASRDCDQKRE